MSRLPELPEYEVLARVAVGGMAEIYRARSRGGPFAGREVALKRLLPAYRSERAWVELFLAEAKMGALLAHPNVVRTYDLFRSGRDYFIVQELVVGETLTKLRQRANASGRGVDASAAVTAVRDLLEALRYLHDGAALSPPSPVVHRDVNPDNVIAGPDGVARLIDFGIAEVQGQPPAVRTGALRGTPAYMSPEQVKSRPLDARSDLFSAGIVLWELLADRPLFAQENEFETLRHVAEVGAPPLRLMRADVPAVFERLLVRALAPHKDRRFQSAAEFLAELAEASRRSGLALGAPALAHEVTTLVGA